MRWFLISVALIFLNFAEENTKYYAVPPFFQTFVKPNVLIILDNSNSMDEDFYGNAVGSYASSSKSVVARKVLRKLIEKYKDKLRVGLMTYKLSNDVKAYYIHNSPYFVSYNPVSYCPNKFLYKVCSNNLNKICKYDEECGQGKCIDPCVEYCKTGQLNYKNKCSEFCKKGNPNFNPDYMDEILQVYNIDSSARNKYCKLIYPKIQKIVNPTDTNHYIYYKHAYPFYANTNQGVGFAYGIPSNYNPHYDPHEGCQCYSSGQCCTDPYFFYGVKVGTSDAFEGYSNYLGASWIIPTDTDIALGYLDFGKRFMWYPVGKTWFSNTSPGGGFLQVPIGDLTDNNGKITKTYKKIWNKLNPHENDENGYMSCKKNNKNKCSYIINAGLTPTVGTLLDAKKTLEQLTNIPPCSKKFIIYITDGLPSVDKNGNKKNADELLPEVLNILKELKSEGIKTYIIGLGLDEISKAKLDKMAQAAGTAINGHAFYADNPEEFYTEMEKIMQLIIKGSQAGSSISNISQKNNEQGSIIHAVFWSEKKFEESIKRYWLGNILGYWLYNNQLREDTNRNKILDLLEDRFFEEKYNNDTQTILIYLYDLDENGNPIKKHPQVYTSLDNLKALINIGKDLLNTNPEERHIYTTIDGKSLIPFDTTHLISLTALPLMEKGIIPLGIPQQCLSCNYYQDCLVYNISPDVCFNNCLNQNLDYYNKLINWIRGYDFANLRFRKITGNPTDKDDKDIWKLGDIIHSSPQLIYYSDKGYYVLYVGANDGMLHAFKIGYIKSTNNIQHPLKLVANKNSENTNFKTEELWAFIPENVLPYLKFLANPNYLHIYTVDLTPYIVKVDINNDGTNEVILIGGMRLGGAVGSPNGITPPRNSCSDWFKQFLQSCGISFPGEEPNFECIGYSSYFALDVTDPEHPKLLWEWSHPDLGFSYSGPAIIKRNNHYYVVFASGPINYEANYPKNDNQDSLKIFVIDLKNGELIRTIDTGIPKAFAGKLSPGTLDVDEDGNTDFLFFGYSRQDGDSDNWKGGLIKLTIADKVENWKVEKYTAFSGDLLPITSGIKVARCFNRYYLFFGTGRWFSRMEDVTSGQSNRLFGIPLRNCNNNTKECAPVTELKDVTDEQNAQNLCNELRNQLVGWYIKLNEKNTKFLKERNITTPGFYNNLVYFITIAPYANVCKSGGSLTFWTLNCALGSNPKYSCNNYNINQQKTPNVFVQTIKGRIMKFPNLTNRRESTIEGPISVMETLNIIEPRKSEKKVGVKILLWLEY